ASLGDIGRHFPATDAAYKDISSMELLIMATRLVDDAGFGVVNIDSTDVCAAPRLMIHIPEMVKRIFGAAGCDSGRVNVKAKTEEGLGFTGSGEGISAYAVALIEEKR
ncbi:MAG: 2-C-methyl-D-erythritol 2,4-cyclodiphosphate synthase, partial [Deltaproteobacteria bacterium]|nr:2-C-methyl-D-erythritol 2,4-cyclodiphosphate synthase [Deltaproteobacteria bacterium]